MSFFVALAQKTSERVFFLRINFWYGAFIVLGVGTAIQALWAKRFKGWWSRRENFTLFILGRPEAPGVPGSRILPASERLGNVEHDLKEQHKDIKTQGADIQEIKILLENVNQNLMASLNIAANTNLKVTRNGGNTDSAPDVLQRVAKKMGVWDHDGKPPISVENVIELHDLLTIIRSKGIGDEGDQEIRPQEGAHGTPESES